MSLMEEENDITKHLNKVSFSEEIERIMKEEKKESYLSAIVEFCNVHGLDFSDITKYISVPLKQKIELEAAELGLMKKGSNPAFTF